MISLYFSLLVNIESYYMRMFVFNSDVDIEAQFSLNQSRAEEITMREDYGSLNLVTHDDGFGDIGFDTDGPDIMRDAMGPEASLEQVSCL